MPRGVFKRKPFTDEHKRHLRENHKGNTGKKFTQEHRRNMSLAQKGRNKGVPLPEEIKRKISLTMIGRKKSAETRRRMSEARKGAKNPQATD